MALNDHGNGYDEGTSDTFDGEYVAQLLDWETSLLRPQPELY